MRSAGYPSTRGDALTLAFILNSRSKTGAERIELSSTAPKTVVLPFTPRPNSKYFWILTSCFERKPTATCSRSWSAQFCVFVPVGSRPARFTVDRQHYKPSNNFMLSAVSREKNPAGFPAKISQQIAIARAGFEPAVSRL